MRLTGQTFELLHWGIAPGRAEVRLTTLSTERARTTKPVDFLKIDVEGHEPAVLGGAAALIESDAPFILLECGHDNNACATGLQQFGYRVIECDRARWDLFDGTAINYLAVPERYQRAMKDVAEAVR